MSTACPEALRNELEIAPNANYTTWFDLNVPEKF